MYLKKHTKESFSHIKRVINIFVDPVIGEIQPYNTVKEMINIQQPSIDTFCLNFFCFDSLLNHGYEVIIHNAFNEHVVLSELLYEPESYGIKKEIRPAHNAYKMFIAGAIPFKSKPT